MTIAMKKGGDSPQEQNPPAAPSNGANPPPQTKPPDPAGTQAPQGTQAPSSPGETTEAPQSTEKAAETQDMDTSPSPTGVPTEQSESSADKPAEFLTAELEKLDEMISRPRWVVPVLPKGELELLLECAIELCKKGLDTQSEACQRFFREGLTVSFTKILTDEAVSGWKYDIHRYILKNAERLVELCVVKLDQDWFPLLDLLAMVLNPASKFHTYNGSRQSETVPQGNTLQDDELFARPPEARPPKGWLVDLVNLFGKLDGFQILHDRFIKGSNLSVPIIAALIRPFGLCFEVLTPHTVQTYFMPIVDIVPKLLDGLTDDELKKESKTEAKNDALSGIIKALKCLVSRIPKQEETIKNLEIFRLKMILRLLQISSFNGKMNALNEVNKVITSVSYYTHRHNSQSEEDGWLTAEKMAEWIQQNNVLSIVLKDSLHQPQYVEKLEKIIRFMIKEKALTLPDLDMIWEAQAGKHEAIEKNVHDLLAKLAWDFSPEQLDHLFECFQSSWVHASKKQREKLLELIRRLAEDDKEGVMANKVLGLLWNLAHSEDTPTEITDQALSAQYKILDYSCSQDRDTQKMFWTHKFVEELKNDKWVIPALKQITEICKLFTEPPQNFTHSQRTPLVYYRNQVIGNLQQQHSIVMLVAQNLTAYMNKARSYAREHPDEDPSQILPDGRYNHIQQVQERLRFLRFLLKDGQLWLCEPQAKQIWVCLAENAIYPCDRENCFKWFSKLMGEEPDLDPEITKDFFEQNILQFDPSLLTETGMDCYERFFKSVNVKMEKLIAKRRGGYMMDSVDLVGMDYLWRVVLFSPAEVAEKGILLIKDVFTNLGPRLRSNQVEIHEEFLQPCMDRLKAAYDTISLLEKDKDGMNRINQEAERMIRVMRVLKEYVAECDDAYGEERAILPLARACRGKHLEILVRFPNQGRQVEDLDIFSHTNDTIGSVRRKILHRVKANNVNLKVELYINGELIDQNEDRKLVSDLAIRDKTLITAKLSQVVSHMPSSPDSSSDSSTGSPHNTYDGPNIEAESCLPGVIMAQNSRCAQFLFQISDIGSQLQIERLRDNARQLLKLMPADINTITTLKKLCDDSSKLSSGDSVTTTTTNKLEPFFFGPSPSQVLYNLEVTYALLMPSQNPEDAYEFQYNFLKSGGVAVSLSMLTKNNFMSNADLHTRKLAYISLLKMCKLLLTAVGHGMVHVVADARSTDSSAAIDQYQERTAAVLNQALRFIPNSNAEYMTRSVAMKLGQALGGEITNVSPDLAVVIAIQKIAWAASSGNLQLVYSSNDELHKAHEKALQQGKTPESDDVIVGREALEVLTVCLALCPQALEALNTKEKAWRFFIIDILLLCKSRSIRLTGTEQFSMIATRCSAEHRPLKFFITLLFTVLGTTVQEYAKQSHEYFQLLWRLLNCAYNSKISISNAETHLNSEIAWLKQVREEVIKRGETSVDEALLEGHLGVTRELLSFQSAEKKYRIGSEKGGSNLVKELVEDFIFPASKIVVQVRKSGGELPSDQAIPVCSTPQSMNAAFDLLVSLCTGCLQNLKSSAEMLTEMYYTGTEPPLNEWEYLPPIGPRPPKGFVGLKNAGATCYMNSVFQQLFMVDPIRTYILATEGACEKNMDDYETEEKAETETNVDSEETPSVDKQLSPQGTDCRKDYNMGVLKHVQVIFAHLSCSSLQYYVPRGFWKHFRLWGEPVNLREQHDSLEFFNSLVDSLDEALKTLHYKPIFAKVMGGSFADQKICKDCPHRYSREESFTTLNIDIRNQENLLESLEQYVKGDLLEGANAYHCDKCNKKVDTVKRLCIKKLPPILAIQLKRFDYDWERECAIKFNDYFEFPREFDMEPFTVQGLAKIEGEVIADENEEGEKDISVCTKYRLVGVVVHSGQASGGHYYSYILHRVRGQTPKWYKFDDGEVTECKMEDDEEMKNQCFGGDYMGEVFDHMLKRMSYRRQKRWWNAYILMYERMDEFEHETEKDISKSMQDLTIDNRTSQVKMPEAIEKMVRKQNIHFMHNKNQFSVDYFQFMRKLLNCNAPYVGLPHGHDKIGPEAEEMALISVQLAAKFLFSVGFHTKKNLRGPAHDWYDALSIHLRPSKRVRHWFAQNVLFAHPERFAEYLLECPSTEVRQAFMKMIVFLAHFALQDGPCAPNTTPIVTCTDTQATLSDHLLNAVLNLLRKEVSDHGRHLQQYFHLFVFYAGLGINEKQQLLKLNVPERFMKVALDEGPGPPIKYQYAELGKLYGVVSQLVRCCDVSAYCESSFPNQKPLANKHGEEPPLMPLQKQVAEILFERTSYVKKLIEDCNNSEETSKLLRFCCWENPRFSSTVLSELLWQVAYSYTYELRPYLDLLLHMLLLDDSWQNHRIHNALRGIPDDRDGLFDTIQRSKNHYQKRAYQCIKMMVNLFSQCGPAAQMMQTNVELKKKWNWAVEWLGDELERRPYSGNTQYTYNNWSPPAQSNETSNGYFLERSHSAKMTLARACELFPEEETDEPEPEVMEEAETSEDAQFASPGGVDASPAKSRGAMTSPVEMADATTAPPSDTPNTPPSGDAQTSPAKVTSPPITLDAPKTTPDEQVTPESQQTTEGDKTQ